MSSMMQRVVLGVSAATLVAVAITAVTAMGFAPAVPWLVSYVVTAALLAALSRVVFGMGGRINRIIGALGLTIALGCAIVIAVTMQSADPALAGGFIAIPYLVMLGLMPLCAAGCGTWGLYLVLRRTERD